MAVNIFSGRNVNDLYRAVMSHFVESDYPVQPSRNGPVRVMPGPVLIQYACPWERVLFDGARNANPFFHFMESMWMLAGRNDLSSVRHYVGRMALYSDDGTTLHGAYGHRWRKYFERDQLDDLIMLLSEDRNTRRAVLSMWDAREDLHASLTGGKDVPCNTQIYFRTRNGELTMTTLCRSNDVIWGALGANAVHLSYLHEFVARHVGLPVGTWWQFSNDYHVYEREFQRVRQRGLYEMCRTDPYLLRTDLARPLVIHLNQEDAFIERLNTIFDGHVPRKGVDYIDEVVWPLHFAWSVFKTEGVKAALRQVGHIKAGDWQLACQEWLSRRMN